jgi:hypothetical protein
MNYAKLALELDKADVNAAEIAWAYELALKESDAQPILFMNLVALYFECNDTGFAAANRLSQPFFDFSYYRAQEVLDLAEKRHGPLTEILFWRLYLRERVLAEDVAEENYIALASRGDSDLPYLPPFLSSNRTRYGDEATRLFSAAQKQDTTRLRYIYSCRGFVSP